MPYYKLSPYKDGLKTQLSLNNENLDIKINKQYMVLCTEEQFSIFAKLLPDFITQHNIREFKIIMIIYSQVNPPLTNAS